MNKKTLIIIISCVAALLGTIGLTYAYFTATVTGNNNASSMIVKIATLSINYTNGNEIEAENVLPGWSTTKTFTVKNTGSTTSYFRLNMDNVTNMFKRSSKLEMNISSDKTKCGILKTSEFPTTNIISLLNGSINAGETCTYTIAVYYLAPTGVDQSLDMNATAIGKIQVESISKDEESINLTPSKNIFNQELLLDDKNFSRTNEGYFSSVYCNTFVSSSSILTSIKKIIKPDKTYTLSRVYSGGTNGAAGSIRIGNASGHLITTATGTGLKSVTFSLTKEQIDSITYAYFYTDSARSGGTYSNIQIEEEILFQHMNHILK